MSGFNAFNQARTQAAPEPEQEIGGPLDQHDPLTAAASQFGPCEVCAPVIDFMAARITRLAAERIALLAMMADDGLDLGEDQDDDEPEPGSYAERARRDPSAYRIAELQGGPAGDRA